MQKLVAWATITSLCIAAGTAMAVTGTASSPTSGGGVVPYLIAGQNEGGNRTCAEVGQAFFGDPNYYKLSSERINYDEDGNVFDQLFPLGVTVTVTDDVSVAWSSTFKIGAVIVKGSNDANVYVYDPQANNDSGLASPPNASGKPAGLSNITFCWNPVKQAQWCSPGYWRQTQHLGSWTATGISPYAYYNYYFDPDLAGNPTLWAVLQSPKTYGGAAFNNVADLLSAKHPDVNFVGERIEDSCPLDRNEGTLPK
jgi:hypothetical protein